MTPAKPDYRKLGMFLRQLREERALGRSQVAAAIRCNEKSLARWEAGWPFADRGRLIRLFVEGLRINQLEIINRGLKLAGFVSLTSDEITRYALGSLLTTSKTPMMFTHKPQKVEWGPNKGKPAGIACYDDGDKTAEFVEWAALKTEVEKKLLNQLGLHIPENCKLLLDEYRGHRDWLVRIIDARKNKLGYVWFGTDADNDWKWDGLVRVGDDTYVVWQVFQRYSDGSYARIRMQKPRLSKSRV